MSKQSAGTKTKELQDSPITQTTLVFLHASLYLCAYSRRIERLVASSDSTLAVATIN